MSRVREIGIYRAIGVKNGNIIFRFLIESAVLTTLTVFAAFLVSSLIAGNLASMNSMKNVMYYPVWLAALLAVFMYGVCLLCGIAPVASLLRRTPSEILSKYDI
ncbi:MAG: ABC transporter permease [Clostridia bacterium]|nr:ABC transporter permease [Clostridia bacterium]